MTTLTEAIFGQLSEVQVQSIDGMANAFFELAGGVVALAANLGERARQRDPAEPYRKFLIGKGVQDPVAGWIGSLVASLADREKEGERLYAAARRAVQYFANAGGYSNVRRKHASALLAVVEATSFLDDLFRHPAILNSEDGATLQSEFESILQRVAQGGEGADLERLKAIAAKLARRLPTRRGRRPRTESIAHENLCDQLGDLGIDLAYTENHFERDGRLVRFTDAASLATAEQFGLRDFDPRPAIRRSRKKRATGKRQ